MTMQEVLASSREH